MKQSQIIGAYASLNKLSALEWPVRHAFQLMLLHNAFEPAYTAGIKMQGRLIEQFGGVESERGVFTFPSDEERIGFSKALEELLDTEVDVAFMPVTLCYEDIEGTKLRPADLRNLVGIVDFKSKIE